MSYSDLLKKREWIEKSASIIQRDSYICQKCGCLGFHSMSLNSYKELKELDNLFSGWSFNNVSFSTFIDKEIQAFSILSNLDNELNKNHKFKVSPYNTYYDETIILNGCSLFRLSTIDAHFRTNRSAYFYCKQIPEKLPVYQRRIVRKSEDSQLSNGLIIKNNGNKTAFEYGNIYMFEKNIVEECIVSVEYIFPTGSNGISTDRFPMLFGSIVVNVSYKNFVGSFYFYPKDSNVVNKEPESYIKGLNVHHKYYIKGLAPWEYEDNALITLCEDCHKTIHQSHVPVYRKIGSQLLFSGNSKTCERCDGCGYLPQYSHVADGICFSCWGEGVVLDDL
jgi:hypothetical protein